MGYYVDFYGEFELDKPLSVEQFNELTDFAHVRHEEKEQKKKGMPGFYCNWVPTKDGLRIRNADGDGSRYYFDKWLIYIIERFIKPWGLVLNGQVEWDGSERGDIGVLIVENNIVSTKKGRITYE